MEVMAIDITIEYTIADQQYWSTSLEFKASLKNNRFFRISLLAENKQRKLTLNDLLNNGLKSAPQGALKVKEPLLSYLHNNFE